MLSWVYVRCRSKTLSVNMKKLNGMLNDKTTDVRGVRSLAEAVLNANIKIMSEAKGCSYQWFLKNASDVESFKETFAIDKIAFESSITRLRAMTPKEWTIVNMAELATRMVNEITLTDSIYATLSSCRQDVIDQKRESMAGKLRIKQQKSMASSRLAKPWIENGANKKIMMILESIGACIYVCIRIIFCLLSMFRTVMVAT
jgi:hypothetical protein